MNLRSWFIGFLFLCGLGFSGYGFYRTFKKPIVIEKGSEKITEQNIQSKTREWLDAFHFGVTNIPNDPAFYWGFEVRLSNKIPVNIVRSKEHEHYLTFIGRVEIVPEHKALFDKLPADKKLYFLERLRVEIARAKISCGFDPPGTLNVVQIEKRVPITDTFAEAQLLDGIGETNYGVILVRDTIGLLLDFEIKQPSPTPNTEASPH